MKYFILIFLLAVSIYNLPAQVYNGTGGPIADDSSPTLFNLDVENLQSDSLNADFGFSAINIDITHPWDWDINAKLIAPDGTEIPIINKIGDTGDNFTNTVLTDTASTPLGSGEPPFTGIFKPIGYLGDFNNGQPGAGTWTLSISDNYPYGDEGYLNSWSLEFSSSVTSPIIIDSTNLPIIKINTLGQVIPDEPKIDAMLQIIENESGFNTPYDVPNQYNGMMGIEIRGTYSSQFPQKPYGIETRDEAGNNNNVPILGMPEENDWILLANYNDKNLMRNTLAYDLFREMGHYSPRVEYCEVLLNDDYRGIYVFTEKVKRDNNRIDIAKLDLDDNWGDSLTGGYILKIGYHNNNDSWQSNFHPMGYPEKDVYFVYYYPKPEEITFQQKTYIQEYVDSFETALYSDYFTDPEIGYRAFIDVNSFIDYMLVNELSRNRDGFKKSRYLYKDRIDNGGLLKAGPVWDFDWAWKNIDECDYYAVTDGSGWSYMVNECGNDVNSPGWMVRLMEDPLFTDELNCRYFELRETILDTNCLFGYIDSVYNYVYEASQRHYTKWPILGYVPGTPELGKQAVTFEGEIDTLKTWITKRLAWLDLNMPGICFNTEVEDIENRDNLKIYPNPAHHHVMIESELAIIEISLFDLTGKKITDYKINNSSKFRLPIRGVKPGFYLLKVHLQNGNYHNTKFIIR